MIIYLNYEQYYYLSFLIKMISYVLLPLQHIRSSTTALQSSSMIMFWYRSCWTHVRPCNNAHASTSVGLGSPMLHCALALINLPWTSHIHIPAPNLKCSVFRKIAASIFNFNEPGWGGDQLWYSWFWTAVGVWNMFHLASFHSCENWEEIYGDRYLWMNLCFFPNLLVSERERERERFLIPSADF